MRSDRYLDMSFLGEGWFQTSLWLIGIPIAILISYIFYRRSIPRNGMDFIVADTEVISVGEESDLAHSLSLQFDGVDVPRVSVATVAIWNSGTSVVDGTAIATASPLRLELPELAKVMRAGVVKASRDVLRTEARVANDHSVCITFDYLDPNDAFIITVIHTGKAGSVKPAGEIKGIPQGLTNRLPRTRGPKPFLLIAGGFALTYFADGLFPFNSVETPTNDWKMYTRAILNAIAPLLVIWGLYKVKRLERGLPPLVRNRPEIVRELAIRNMF